ncbi:uncharacterized protein I303_107023 [Kwoniella dejecticola CBS 10117]|uniref:RRM domain-containing protein n=1 Tax=Kwoniella dejecticola CBS 10117 TaxID=1296121 RepID=A0A1A5ZYH7_9TREE|nr:uncharacterized protein I303_06424 [Kwoniella dejecticola CBS 10117]OBR82867.1 hypothetical protein I303_06424 [Kwoniella dejecticola CBS 10117]
MPRNRTQKLKSKHSDQPKHTPNPFQLTLHITNLPPTIKPSHFTYILSHQVHYANLRRRGKRDPGITLIQIYHLPLAPAPSPPASRLIARHPICSSIFRDVIRRILCISSGFTVDDDDHSRARQGEAQRLDADKLESPPTSPTFPQESRVSERAVEEPEEVQGDHTEIPRGSESMSLSKTDEEVQTVAWIHFEDEDSLYQAKDILRSITIDGRKIVVKTDRFNGALLKRVWQRDKRSD